MEKKAVSGIMLTLLILAVLTSVFNFYLVKASPGTIYIRADGSIDPPTAPISSVDSITYTFTGDIYDEIVVERSNIIVDGNGYTLQGSGGGNGFYLSGPSDVSNVTIKNTIIKDFEYGVNVFWGPNNITVSGNNIENNDVGIYLYLSSGNTVSGNNIENNAGGVKVVRASGNISRNTIRNNTGHGVMIEESSGNIVSGNTIRNNGLGGVGFLRYSDGNTVSGNTIKNNEYGIYLFEGSRVNMIYHNNFIDNTNQVTPWTCGCDNIWDDGYPSGGNYWSDYEERYPDAEEIDDSGIWNTPYVINEENTDGYPLMNPWAPQLPWWMFHHDPRHTGYSREITSQPTELIWTYETSGWVDSSPAIAYSKVFVGSDDGNVYALDENTGSLLWSFPTGDKVRSSPLVMNEKVYVGSFNTKVYALSQSDGTELWSYPTNGRVYSSPVLDGDTLIVGSDDGYLHAIDADTGLLRWKKSYGGGYSVRSSPAVSDGKVYVGWRGETGQVGVYSLDISDGSIIWYRATVNWVESSPAVADGMVFVGTHSNYVRAFNASDGAPLWEYRTDGMVKSSPAVAYGKVFVGSYDGSVYALEESTGNKIWSFQTGAVVHSSPAVSGNMVFVGSADDYVYVLNDNGVLLWKYKTGGDVFSSPALANNKVFIGSKDNIVYAFGVEEVPVGGVLVSIDKLGLLAPYIALAIAVVAITIGAVYARKRWFGKAVVQRP